jgi:hypothetical protein
MEQRNDYLAAGQAILEFQLALMRGAMSVAGQGAQRMLELGFAAAASSTGDSLDATPKLVGSRDPKDVLSLTAALASANTKRAASYGSRFSDLRFATSTQLASANREYVERVQENVDSMLHALAMAPVAADRLIRAAAAASEQPSRAAAGPASTSSTSSRRAPPKPGKARRPRRTDHAD